MSSSAATYPNGAAKTVRPAGEPLLTVLRAIEDQALVETIPTRRLSWEKVGRRILSLLLTAKGRIEEIDLTAEQEGGEVVVGVRFPEDPEGRRFHARLESLDHDAQTAVQVALIQRGLATPVRVAVALHGNQ